MNTGRSVRLATETEELRISQILEDMDRRLLLDLLVSILEPRERSILFLRFGVNGSPMTLQEVADLKGVRRERIRQIEARALRALRRQSARRFRFDRRGVAFVL